jgi:hypothetical protein
MPPPPPSQPWPGRPSSCAASRSPRLPLPQLQRLCAGRIWWICARFRRHLRLGPVDLPPTRWSSCWLHLRQARAVPRRPRTQMWSGALRPHSCRPAAPTNGVRPPCRHYSGAERLRLAKGASAHASTTLSSLLNASWVASHPSIAEGGMHSRAAQAGTFKRHSGAGRPATRRPFKPRPPFRSDTSRGAFMAAQGSWRGDVIPSAFHLRVAAGFQEANGWASSA